jgi:hypothetical protein
LVGVDPDSGTIDIKGPAGLLLSGVALFDLAPDGGAEGSPNLQTGDTPVFMLERPLESSVAAAQGAVRFTMIETGLMGRTVDARVFGALADGQVQRLYTSNGAEVIVTGINASEGTLSFRFTAPGADAVGTARTQVAFADMALYQSANAAAIGDRPVLRLLSEVESAPQAMSIGAARVVGEAAPVMLNGAIISQPGSAVDRTIELASIQVQEGTLYIIEIDGQGFSHRAGIDDESGDIAEALTTAINAQSDYSAELAGTIVRITSGASEAAISALMQAPGTGVKLSGISAPFYNGQRLILIDGSETGKTGTISSMALDSGNLNIAVADSGAGARTILDNVTGLPKISRDSIVSDLSIAVVQMPPGFDGTFIKGQEVFEVDEEGNTTRIGIVDVYKAGARELHIALDDDQVVTFGTRIYSEYIAQGDEAHGGEVVSQDDRDVDLRNKRVLWEDLDPALFGLMGFASGDNLVSSDGRTLLEIGYVGVARDAYGNLMYEDATSGIDLIFNRLRAVQAPFQPNQRIDLLKREAGDSFESVIEGENYTVPGVGGTVTEDDFNIRGGALDVAFGPNGWDVILTDSAAVIFAAELENYLASINEQFAANSGNQALFDIAFNQMAQDPDRLGLYLSSLPLLDNDKGQDTGRVVGWNARTNTVTLEILRTDRAEAHLGEHLGEEFFLRLPPVFRVDDAGFTPEGVAVDGNTVTLDLNPLTFPENHRLNDRHTHVYMLDAATDALIAVATVDRETSQTSIRDQNVNNATPQLIATLADGSVSDWSLIDDGSVRYVLAEAFDVEAKVASAEFTGEIDEDSGAKLAKVTLDADDAVMIEFSQNTGAARFAQVLGVVAGGFGTTAFGKVVSVAQVYGQYELTVAMGQNAALPLAGEMLRLGAASRIPIFVLPDAGKPVYESAVTDFSAGVKLSDLDWTVTLFEQTVDLGAGHGLKVDDRVTLVEAGAESGSVVGVVTAVNGGSVTLELRRGENPFDNVEEFTIIRQDALVGGAAWKMSGSTLITEANNGDNGVELATDARTDVYAVEVEYKPTDAEQEILDALTAGDTLTPEQVLVFEQMVMPFRPIVNDRLHYRGFIGEDRFREDDQATVRDVQELEGQFRYLVFVEVRYQDLQDPALAAGMKLEVGDGKKLDILAAGEVESREIVVDAAEFEARRAKGLYAAAPREFYANQQVVLEVDGTARDASRETASTSEVQRIHQITPQQDASYRLSLAGQVLIAEPLEGGDIAALVDALQAADGYDDMPFTVAADGDDLLLTWKAAGVVVATARIAQIGAIGRVADWNPETEIITLSRLRSPLAGEGTLTLGIDDLVIDESRLASDIDTAGAVIVGDRVLIELQIEGGVGWTDAANAPRIGSILLSDGVEIGRIVGVDMGPNNDLPALVEVVITREALIEKPLNAELSLTWTPAKGVTAQTGQVGAVRTDATIAAKLMDLAARISTRPRATGCIWRAPIR